HWRGGYPADTAAVGRHCGVRRTHATLGRWLTLDRGEGLPSSLAGTVDAGYPAPISNWNWPSGFGSTGIDAALYSGSKCYFFKGNRYIRVTRGDTGAGTVDAGYPAPITNWGWPRGFAGAPGPTVRLHVKVLTAP
ncbi:hemopexin repeat-containing protein, partial [Acinetobacter baumannii]|uniref:hemopexin repeat-containing protein n=1 Tax=Acinetobacter baumannii TaxID=470 RepID=UPI001C095867